MGGGGTSTNTISNSEPWKGAQPYLTDLMSQAQQTYDAQKGQTGYAPFNTVVQPSAQTNLGLDLTTQRALQGSPVTGAAGKSLTDVLSGASSGSSALDYFSNPSNINPYLKSQFDAASKPVIDAVNAQFSLGGRTGSVANQNQLTRNLSDLSANIFSNGYDNAANRAVAAGQASNQGKIQASAIAPSVAGSDYTDLQNLLNVGGAKDSQSQNQINDLLTRWSYQNQQPWNILNQYGGAISGLGSVGGSSSSTGKSGQDQTASLVGGGLSLAAAALPLLGLL